MEVSRRSFVGGALALGAIGGGRGATALPIAGRAGSPLPAVSVMDAQERVPPNLRFGVVSDVHIGGKPDAMETLEKVLRWFASEKVDAVLCPGDIAHSGNIQDLEKFADVWHRVFPCAREEGRGKREEVALMIATGNHDVDAWGGRWKNFTEEQMLAQRFNYKQNPEKTWQRLFGQKWELIWRREVKGYTFIGSQWSSLKPPLEDYFKAHAAELRGDRPFFYCQHAHPKGTCHGSYSMGDDHGESVRALSPFPNAVAITGHSHCAISDERTVWQGAFTSIGAGCIHEGAGGFNYDNVAAFWHPSSRKNLMGSLADPKSWGGDAKGGGCELVEVFDDHLVVHRQSIDFGRPIGPAWVVPIGGGRGATALPNATIGSSRGATALPNVTFDFAKRAAQRKAQGAVPQFAAGAKIVAKFCPKGHPLESAAHKGEPCTYVTFPRAKTVKGSRVFDYIVEAVADAQERVPPVAAGRGLPALPARPPVTRKLIAAGFAYPEEKADLPGECLFSAAELPPGKSIRFTVTPRDCFGLAGHPLSYVVNVCLMSQS